MFLPYITLTAQIPAALQSHGSHYKPYILWLQADFIQKYPKCCVLPKFTIFHIHLIFPCCPSYIPPLSAARISWMGPFPDRPDIPLPPLPGAPHPPVPSYSPMVVTISAKKVIALVALSAYYMVGLLISMRQNRKGGKLSGPYGIVSGKQGL